MLIIILGTVFVYIYYLKDKKEQLDAVKRGFCPQCHQKSIELTDQRSGSCSGPKILSYECLECGYANSFAVENSGSCGSGRCH